jgi:hypothetical protein
MSHADDGPSWYYSEHGRQAGPVAATALREMASSGRLGAQDLVWREGMGNWMPVSTVPELAASLPVPAASWPVAPPPLPAGFAPPSPRAPIDYRGMPQPYPSTGGDPSMRWLIPVGRSGWAIAAGYLGLFSFFGGFLGPVAVIVSIVAIRDIKRHPDRHGMGRAIFGLIAGILGTFLLVFVVIGMVASAGHPSYRRYGP